MADVDGIDGDVFGDDDDGGRGALNRGTYKGLTVRVVMVFVVWVW